ncbi:MAG: adenylate/guanylate cyclase domain-containing protein [Chloroflexota bacterium]|nr:adenylate/guanylate cyclase domain-containing protein [Chloroflexota bacterium]
MTSDMEPIWRGILMGTDPRYRRARSFLQHVPYGPRCKMCAAPFAGPFAPLLRLWGRGRWSKNPKYCRNCFGALQQLSGGAEVPCTLLFADVRGSTALAEQIPATEFTQLLQRFYGIATRVLVAHDAIVDKFVGDEVMAIFIPALSQERHAARAIDAAVALLRANQEPGAGAPLPIGAGVHSGTAYVGSIGEGLHTELTALGDVVNTAARLASAASAGEVLVSLEAGEAAGLEMAPLEHRSLDLKGKSAATQVAVLTPLAGSP